jgi:hypothetical protein
MGYPQKYQNCLTLENNISELPEHPDLSKTKIVTTFKPLDCSEPFADHNDTVEFHFTGT